MAKIISTIQFKRNTFSNWQSKNPVLANGEPGYEIDTNKFKIGDGITGWNTLTYQGGSGGASALVDLTDVVISGTLAENEIVAYDVSTSKWINQTAAEAGLATASHTHTLDAIPLVEIGAGVDLNNYTTQGLFHQSQNVEASGGTNYPVAYAGFLEVYASGGPTGFVYQRYTTYQGAPASYWRAKYVSAWSSWARTDNQTLDSLTNVVVTSNGDGELLVWDVTTGKWINNTLDEANIVPKTGGAFTGSLSGVSPTATGSNGFRNTTISTVEPTGGSDGDVWLVYI